MREPVMQDLEINRHAEQFLDAQSGHSGAARYLKRATSRRDNLTRDLRQQRTDNPRSSVSWRVAAAKAEGAHAIFEKILTGWMLENDLDPNFITVNALTQQILKLVKG